MSKKIAFLSISVLCMFFAGPVMPAEWKPPSQVSRAEIVAMSDEVLKMPDIKIKAKEEIFRIRAAGMDWDVGGMIYEPEDSSKIPTGPDSRKIGLFLLHGGAGDHRSWDSRARLLAGKFGFKVVTMTYPGNLYLLDPSRNWPGDSIHPDGTVRTPIWNKDILITADQYKVVEDKEPARRKRWGTLILASAKEGTEFYSRLASWPLAFEEAGKNLLHRHFPEGEYSIYGSGHSTGGPFIFMFSQRIPNFAGVISMESSPFGYMYGKMLQTAQDIDEPWDIPFYNLRIRSWRDTARYAGFEALDSEGPEALKRLAMLMEEVFESWQKGTTNAQFKAENMIHFNGVKALTEAARATAKRLEMNPQQTEALVQKYIGYTKELSGPGVKPVPAVFLGIAKASRDHSPQIYKEIYLPMFAAMKPAPKTSLVQFDAGTHGYARPEPGLPMGVAPVVAKLWRDAIMNGYFLQAR